MHLVESNPGGAYGMDYFFSLELTVPICYI